jgi:cell shape-determining protein MreC
LLSGGGAAAALIGLVVLIVIAVRLVAPSVLARISTPLWNIGSHLTASVGSVTSPAQPVADTEKLSAQNAALTEENAALTAKVADLTALLGTRAEPENAILASVIARPPVAPYDVLIIDQGTNASVALGALALGPGGTPIGTVGVVNNRESRIALFSTKGLETSAWVGSTRLPLTLVGAGAGTFTASVPRTAPVVPGDGVYVAAAGAVPIGTVVSIDSEPSSPTVDLRIRPYTNPFSITWVTVAR